MKSLAKALEMTRTLLDLAERGEWQEFERVQLKREEEIKRVLAALSINKVSIDTLPEGISDDLRLLQEMNVTLLTKATPEMKRVMADMAKLEKNNKANSVYKEMR
jgi:hypothetical protein